MLYILLLLLIWLPPDQPQPSPNQTIWNATAHYESLLHNLPTSSHFNRSEFSLAERIHTITFPNGTNLGDLIFGKTVEVHENISSYLSFQIQKDHVAVFSFGTNISTVSHSIFAKTTEKVQWLTVDCGIIKQHTFGNRVGLGEGNKTASNHCQTEQIVLVAVTNVYVSGEIYSERRFRTEDYTYVFLILIMLLTGLGYYLLLKICKPEEETDDEKLEKIRSILENYESDPILWDAGTQMEKEDDKKHLHIFLIVLLFLTVLGWLLDNRSRIQNDRNVTDSPANDSSAFFWNSFKNEMSSLEVHVPPRSKDSLVKKIRNNKWPNGTGINDLLIGKKIKVKEHLSASVIFQLKENQIGVFAFNESISSFTEQFLVNTTDETLWLFAKCGIITDYVVSNKKRQEHVELNIHFSIQCKGPHFSVLAIPRTKVSGSIYIRPISPSPYVAIALILLTIWFSTDAFEFIRDIHERYQRRKRIMKMGFNGLSPNTDPNKEPSKVETLEQVMSLMEQSNEEGDETIHIIVWIRDEGTQTDFEGVEENWFWNWVPSWLKKDKEPLDAINQLEKGVFEDDGDEFHDAMSCFTNEALATPDFSLN